MTTLFCTMWIVEQDPTLDPKPGRAEGSDTSPLERDRIMKVPDVARCSGSLGRSWGSSARNESEAATNCIKRPRVGLVSTMWVVDKP